MKKVKLRTPPQIDRMLTKPHDLIYYFTNDYGENWLFVGDDRSFSFSGVDVGWEIEKKELDDWVDYYSKTMTIMDSQWILSRIEKQKRTLAKTKLASLHSDLTPQELMNMESSDEMIIPPEIEKFLESSIKMMVFPRKLDHLDNEYLMGFDDLIDDIESHPKYLSREYPANEVDQFLQQHGMDITAVLHVMIDLRIKEYTENPNIEMLLDKLFSTEKYLQITFGDTFENELTKSRTMFGNLDEDNIVKKLIDYLLSFIRVSDHSLTDEMLKEALKQASNNIEIPPEFEIFKDYRLKLE